MDHNISINVSCLKMSLWVTLGLLPRLMYSKTCVKRPLSKQTKIGFQDQLSLNAGQQYCRMLQGEHSAILLIFIKLPFVIKIFVLSILSGRFTQVILYCSCIFRSRVVHEMFTAIPGK